MAAIILRGDARSLPLPDASVDLVCTSPPYFGLRSYSDNGGHYDGQIGSEETPREYIAALIECTREWMRVLKPSGSIFVNLGDKYAGGGQGGNVGGHLNGGPHLNRTPAAARNVPQGFREKSLMGLPWRYALACTDDLGLILRRDIIWHKVNGLPESVTDRCRSSHEYLFHLVKQPRYFSAVDEIREAYSENKPWGSAQKGPGKPSLATAVLRGSDPSQQQGGLSKNKERTDNPLGKLPGSVWDIPSQPLIVPDWLDVDHFAAFPMELPRRIIQGWSPPGICTECGEGRRPVADQERVNAGGARHRLTAGHITAVIGQPDGRTGARKALLSTITGYACTCAPYTDHAGTGDSSGAGYGDALNRGEGYARTGYSTELHARPKVGPWREYHLDRWTPPPVTPAVVVDVFGGTGTTSLVADVLGRTGITVDRSADYCRLARWRTTDPAERAKALGVPKPPPVPHGQASLFDLAST